MVWYSFLFQNFPQFLVIHTVKGFGVVNKAEIDVFLELSYGGFSYAHIQWKSSVATEEESTERKHFPKNTSPEQPCGQLQFVLFL